MKLILNESRRDDMLLPYVNLLRSKGINTNVSQLKQYLLRKFVNEGLMRNLSLGSNFYLAGVARYYFNGDLTVNKVLNVFDENQADEFKSDICERLNACILVLRNAHIDSVGESFEQPEDFGELSITKLLRKYNVKINDVLGIKPVKKTVEKKVEKIDNNPVVGNGYTFDILYSYEDARKYKKFTEPGAWCITYGEQHYNSYIRNLGIHYVILRKEGFESIPRKKGANWTEAKPQDEYGNSLIALLQSNKNGEPEYITSRWNHGTVNDHTKCEADHAYTKQELFAVTGMNDNDLQRIFKLWDENREKKKNDSSAAASQTKKKTLEALRYVKYGQMRMNGGEDIQKVFKGVKSRILFGKEDSNYKKNICVLTIPIWGEDEDIPDNQVTILCDKGKMSFDTFKLHSMPFYGTNRIYKTPYNRDDFFSLRVNDLIVIEQDNYTQLYDVRRHKLIGINGVTKFKYFSGDPSSWEVDYACYYEVAMSNNQRALIDYRTNIPLRLPNGEYWFESWVSQFRRYNHYGREVKTNVICLKDCSLKILYDSASDEKYFLDIKTKSFFNIKTDDDFHLDDSQGDTISVKQNIYTYRFTNSTDGFIKVYYKVYQNGKEISIDNHNKFTRINTLHSGSTIVSFTPYGSNETIIYDINSKQEIKLIDYNNNIVIPSYIAPVNNRYDSDYNLPLFWVVLPTIQYHNKALYDIENKRFLLNPLSHDYMFFCYSDIFTGNKENAVITNYNSPFISYDVRKERHGENLPIRVTTKITLSDIYQATEKYSSTVGDMPKNGTEMELRYLEKYDSGEISQKRMENRMISNEMNFILSEVIKHLK